MKKLILATALLASLGSTVAMADPYYGYHPNRYGSPVYGPVGGYGHGYRGNTYNNYRGSSATDILVPMVIGGVVGYAISNSQKPSQPQQVIVQQPTVVQQAPVVQDSVAGDVYHYENVYLDSCSCNRRVLVRD